MAVALRGEVHSRRVEANPNCDRMTAGGSHPAHSQRIQRGNVGMRQCILIAMLELRHVGHIGGTGA